MRVIGGNAFAGLTATAGTVINCLLPPRAGLITRLMNLTYLGGGTAHTITVLRPIGTQPVTTQSPTFQQAASYATVSAAVAAGNATFTLNSQAGSNAHKIQANDWLAITETDGVTRVYQVQSINVAGGLTPTLTANLTAGVGIGSPVWSFGATGTTDPNTGLAHPSFTGTASTTAAAPSVSDTTGADIGVAATFLTNSPLLIQSNNATNAGTFTSVIGAYNAPELTGVAW